MTMATSRQLVSIYLNEGDEWEKRPLHHEILQQLFRFGCAGGTVLRGLAGFTASAGGPGAQGVRPPVVVMFIDAPEKVAASTGRATAACRNRSASCAAARMRRCSPCWSDSWCT